MPRKETGTADLSRPAAARRPAAQPQAAAPARGRASLQRALAAPASASPREIQALQRKVGNRAVARLTAAGSFIQAKLAVGPADDKYEQEADRVAGEVMRSAAPASPPAVEGTEAKGQAQRQPLSSAITPLAQRTAPVGEGGGEAGSEVESRLAATRGGGNPMPQGTRTFMEDRFGADFGGVRLHTDRQAAILNRHLSATAFTHGPDIYFGSGASQPGTTAGNRLLAHELTHVVQQGAAGPAASAQRKAIRPKEVQKKGVIQTWNPFKKKKKAKPEEQTFAEETGELPATSTPYFIVRLAVATGTETRGDAKTFSEYLRGIAGHAWLELDLGPDFANLEEMKAVRGGGEVADALEASTIKELNKSGTSTIGFYPAANNFSKMALLKQLFGYLPGSVSEPEGENFAGHAKGSKAFVLTDPKNTVKMLQFIAANRYHKYSLLKYNCTDWAVDAIKAAGHALPGDVTTKARITSPNLLYRRIYQSLELGDKTTKVADLKKSVTDKGRRYDFEHIEPAGQKKLEKRKLKAGGKAKKDLGEKQPSKPMGRTQPVTAPVEVPKGTPYQITNDLEGGAMPGGNEVKIPTGAVVYCETDPNSVEPWQAMEVSFGGRNIYVIPADLLKNSVKKEVQVAPAFRDVVPEEGAVLDENALKAPIDYWDSDDNYKGKLPRGAIIQQETGTEYKDQVEVQVNGVFWWVKKAELRAALG